MSTQDKTKHTPLTAARFFPDWSKTHRNHDGTYSMLDFADAFAKARTEQLVDALKAAKLLLGRFVEEQEKGLIPHSAFYDDAKMNLFAIKSALDAIKEKE